MKFVIDDADKLKRNAELGIYPKHLLLGGYELEEEGLAEIIDSNNVGRTSGIFVTNVPKYSIYNFPIISTKVLINLNSNHHLKPRKGFKTYLRVFAYTLFNKIICLSSTQKQMLMDAGIPPKKIHVVPLGINDDVIKIAKKRAKKGDYFISAGGDAGREFDFDIDPKIKIKVFNNENKVSYIQYCEELCGSKGLVLRIRNNKDSSDLSGSVTVLEALAAKKPVFINPQPWLVDYPNPNVYVYKDGHELEKLLKKDIKWKPCDISYILMPRYLRELKTAIYSN